MLNYIERCDRYSGFLVWLFAIVFLAVAFSSCNGPRAAQAQAELRELQDVIYADGVVTPEENMQLAAALAKIGVAVKEDAESINWPQAILSLILSLGAGVPASVIAANKVRNARERRLGEPVRVQPTVTV